MMGDVGKEDVLLLAGAEGGGWAAGDQSEFGLEREEAP